MTHSFPTRRSSDLMERGVIDAFEFNNPSSDMRFGAQDVAKHYLLSSYHQASECFEFLFNAAFFDDLDPDLQAILTYGVEAASTSNTAPALNYYSAALQTLLRAHGVTVHPTSQSILARSDEHTYDIPSLMPNSLAVSRL